MQGCLGDCYLVSVLAALAEQPKRIQKLFKTQQPNKAGCYVVQMCVGGIWQDIVVDDYLPCSNGRPIYGHTQSGALWVALIEKAWAKLCGSYQAIVMGTADMGFIHLCGMPSFGLKHVEYRSKRDELWRKMKTA